MSIFPTAVIPKNLFAAFRQKPAASIHVSPLLIEAAVSDADQVLAKLQTTTTGLSDEEAEQRLEKYGPNAVGLAKDYTWGQRWLHASLNSTALLLAVFAGASAVGALVTQDHDTKLNAAGTAIALGITIVAGVILRFFLEKRHHPRLILLDKAIANPLVILLSVLAQISLLTGDPTSASVMVFMVVLGVVLRFWQEARADTAAAKLKAMISVTATVIRAGAPKEIPLAAVVPGDVVKLAAGDMIPADARVVTCKDLFVIQASLTGESLPVEKFDAKEVAGTRQPLEHRNICFLGTSVESGTATAVIIATGPETYFGGMASAITGPQLQTSFDRGVSRFTWLMLRYMLVMVPAVFLINWLTKSDYHQKGLLKWLAASNWKEAFFFSMAVAVGLTPEMLPMIVTVCLSKGAILMSRKKVIVKRLNSIQNFGAMDVLCTDKTGTLTLDRVILEKHCDVVRHEDEGVLDMAYLNSFFQTGLKNLLDRAVLETKTAADDPLVANHKKVDEIPFDFSRKIMSVVVQTPEGKHRLICKGAPEEVYKRCLRFELNGEIEQMEQIVIDELRDEYEALSSDGFRVLAVAYRDMDPKAAYSKEDESSMILRGYIAFLDPPKESAGPAIEALRKHGVAIKVLTGDNDLVSRKICHEVGIPTEHVLVGTQVEAMSDAQLAQVADQTTLFARLSPAHKQRIIRALQSLGHTVGFMGDGINDAPALRAADVGISVDTAVDIAKESADMILLEKSLMILEEGVMEGRKVFANILKYIRMGASSNFGNMFSVLGASAWFPFEPMEPIQLLTNNLLYDFSQVPIPTDNVDPEQVTKPRPWSMKEISRFILLIGPISSIFDYTTYVMMWFLFKCNSVNLHCPPDVIPYATEWAKSAAGSGAEIGAAQIDFAYRAALFQTGWFVESLLTQTLIIHAIRTNQIPFLQSRASMPMTLTTLLIMALGIYLPYSPLAPSLHMTHLPGLYWPLLLATLLCYLLLTQFVKMWLVKKAWI